MESESIENDIRMLYFSLVQQFIEENRCLISAIAAKQMTRDYGMLQQCFRRLHHNLLCMGRLVDIQTLYTGGIRADKQFADEMTRRHEEQCELDQEADAEASASQGAQSSGADATGRFGGAKRRVGRRRTAAAGDPGQPATPPPAAADAGGKHGPGPDGPSKFEQAQALEGLIAQMRASSHDQPQQLALLQSLVAQLKQGTGRNGHTGSAAAAATVSAATAASGQLQGEAASSAAQAGNTPVESGAPGGTARARSAWPLM